MSNETNPWFELDSANPIEARASGYRIKLRLALMARYSSVTFDHIQLACLGQRIAVFVAKGDQSAVLYDKTKGFPSAKLMASLVLLGSP